jgi:hypothetical protein
MAIVHVNGFGTLPVAGDYLTPTVAASGTSTFSRQVGRYNGYALRHSNSTSGTAGNLTARLGRVATVNEFSLGVAINHRGSWAPSSATFGFLIDAATDWEVQLGSAGNVYVAASGATAWTTVDGSATATGWHWWNLLYRFSATVGVCEVYRDGALLARANGDTAPTGGLAPIGVTLYLGNDNGGAQADFGDLVWRDDATVIPDTVVSSLFPDGTSAGAWLGSDGNSVDNHLLVNDNPTYSAATYVGSATVSATDTYTVGNLPNSAASVDAVQIGARSFKSDAGAKTLAPMINGTAGTAADPGGGATIYQLATTNPSGGAAWDTTSVNAMTAGIRVVS